MASAVALCLAAYMTAAWSVQPTLSTLAIRAAAALCIDEFEKLPLPLLPYPGWQERAREEAVMKWTSSRKPLLAGSQPHALIVAVRDETDSGRYFEGVADEFLGFAEMGLLPAPPERRGKEPVTAAEAAAASKTRSDPQLYPYLANLAVKRGARRLGLGKELVLATERKAADFGFDRLYIRVDRQHFDARRLYDRLGYRLVHMQPRTDVRKGAGADIFLRKDGLREDYEARADAEIAAR